MSQFKTNKAVFIGAILEKGSERRVQEYLEELRFLAETAGATGDKMFTQRMDRPDKTTYIGPGKLEEIKKQMEITNLKERAENHLRQIDSHLSSNQEVN